MLLPVRDVLSIVVGNTLRKGSPISIPSNAASGWAKDISLPKGGEVVLYTSLLYQMVPYTIASTRYLEKLERGSTGSALLKLGKMVSSVFDVSKLASGVSQQEISQQHEILKTIAGLLKRAGVEFGYLYDEELYAGTLLYDFGRDKDFAEHAKRIYEIFKRNGVRKIIAIDPHTTHVLREAYPKFVDGFDIEVENYLEILVERGISPKRKLKAFVAVHDPCYYARYLDIIDQPRELLSGAGVEIREPFRTRRLTFCCGGPVESLSPRISKEVASLRVSELREACEDVVTMCPFCYVSLSRAGQGEIRIKDISLYLKEAYL